MKIFSHVLILISTLCLCSCAGLELNGPLRAVVSGITAVVQSQDDAEKCSQGHAQDRINCRKKKEHDVQVISKSIDKQLKSQKDNAQQESVANTEEPITPDPYKVNQSQEYIELEEFVDPKELAQQGQNKS